MDKVSIKPEKQTQEIVRLTKKAMKYQYEDPEAALILARKAAEAICADIFKAKVGRDPYGLQFGVMIENIARETTVFPKEIEYSLRIIQNFGGINAHGNIHRNIDEYIPPALMFLPMVVRWYFREYKQIEPPKSMRLDFPIKEKQVIETQSKGSQTKKEESPASNNPRLTVILEGGSDGKTYSLDSVETAIGRNAKDLKFSQDKYMSAEHVKIVRQDSKYWLIDTNSHNGVYKEINEKMELKSGDRFMIGRHVFRFDL